MLNFAVRWQNFRGFEDSGWIGFRALTVIVGANNSGKTSLHAPLLMLKQSLTSRDPRQALLLKGPLINLGSYSNLVFGHDEKRLLTLSVRFFPTSKGKPRGAIESHPPAECTLEFASDGTGLVFLQSFTVADSYGRTQLRRVRDEEGNYSIEDFIGDQFDQTSQQRKVIENAKPERFLFESQSVFQALVPDLVAERAALKGLNISRQTNLYLAIIRWTSMHVREVLNEINYVGPLRERPRRLYELSGQRPANVGVRGEYAPEILFRGGNSTDLKEVSAWLERFDFTKDLRVEKISEESYKLSTMRTADSPVVNIADTGFGLSQVLPLIVQGLYAREDSVLLAEQPEIHLNPKLQGVLGSLFASHVSKDRGVIVETHSEHLILRIRKLIAEESLQASNVALYFVERVGDRSVVREVPVDSLGHVDSSSWPIGFFEESMRESMQLAISQARRKKRAR